MTGWAEGRRQSAAIALAALVLLAALWAVASARASDRSVSPESAAPFIRVLGTVQDGGLPHAACEHEGCRLVREGLAPQRWVASLAVVLPDSKQVFLIDATPDIRQQLDLLRDVRVLPDDRVDRSPVDGIFLTHAHIGHYLGLAFFGFEAVSTSRLPVWATPRMAGFLRANGPWSQLVELENIELLELTAESPVALAPEVSVTPFAVPHRDELSDTVGYVIRGPNRAVLYVPDTDRWSTWEPSLLDRLADIDVALIDGSFFSADELPGRSLDQIPHPMIGATMDLLDDPVSKGELEVVFIHLNHSNPALLADSAARREIEARGFAVAAEGLELGL